MESIAAFDAKTRLSELLDRAAKGETFQITKHGRPVGKLVPPDTARDPEVIAEAVQRLKRFRGTFKGMGRDELIALKHEGTGSDRPDSRRLSHSEPSARR